MKIITVDKLKLTEAMKRLNKAIWELQYKHNKKEN